MQEMTIPELRSRMESGELTARGLAEMYLERIETLDKAGRALNAVIEVNPDALAIADALDAEREAQGPARPAARHPGHAQGQHRHRRPHEDHRRLAGPGGLDRAAGFHRRAQAARRRARSSWARPTSASGPTSARRARPAAGAAGAGRRATPMPWTATPAAPAPARRWPWPPTCAPRPSAPRPTARSSARRRPTASSGSSPRWAWSAARASSPSPTARTPPARWRAPWPTRRSCWAR